MKSKSITIPYRQVNREFTYEDLRDLQYRFLTNELIARDRHDIDAIIGYFINNVLLGGNND